MPMVDFSFFGRFDGVTVNEAYDREGNKVDVNNLTVYELALALNQGELTIDLAQALADHVECQATLQGFCASRFRPRTPVIPPDAERTQ